MKSLFACAAVLCFATAANGQLLTLPKEVRGEVGDFIVVRAITEGSEVRWFAPDRGLRSVPAEMIVDKKATVVVGRVAGSYRLICWTAVKDQPTQHAQTVVILTDPDEPDPGPGPGPGPGPTPKPEPTDPLYITLKAAYAKELPQDRPKKTELAALCRQMAKTAKEDKSIQTADGLMKVQQQARKNLIGEALPFVRAAIGAYLDKTVPRVIGTLLDDRTRTIYETEFTKLAQFLEVLR